jgi:hypothetical protein
MVVKTSCVFFSPVNGTCEMQHSMSQSPYYWVHFVTKMNLNMFVDAINNIKLDLTFTPMKCGKKVKQVDLFNLFYYTIILHFGCKWRWTLKIQLFRVITWLYKQLIIACLGATCKPCLVSCIIYMSFNVTCVELQYGWWIAT